MIIDNHFNYRQCLQDLGMLRQYVDSKILSNGEFQSAVNGFESERVKLAMTLKQAELDILRQTHENTSLRSTVFFLKKPTQKS